MRHALFALAAVLAAGLAPAASAQSVEHLDTNCPPGASPAFAAGTQFAALKARLGNAMGQPLTCVIADPSSGDSYQFTDTGLAAYRKAADLTTFTNGDRHWALTNGGAVQWDDGSLMPQAIPPTATAAALPADPQGPPHCGVDLVTDAGASFDTAGGALSSSTSMGAAEACFQTHFQACTPATMASYILIASYRMRIAGPAADGGCQVISSFVDNINPNFVGKEMSCDLDNSVAYTDASQDLSRCSGALYDLLYGSAAGG